MAALDESGTCHKLKFRLPGLALPGGGKRAPSGRALQLPDGSPKLMENASFHDGVEGLLVGEEGIGNEDDDLSLSAVENGDEGGGSN